MLTSVRQVSLEVNISSSACVGVCGSSSSFLSVKCAFRGHLSLGTLRSCPAGSGLPSLPVCPSDDDPSKKGRQDCWQGHTEPEEGAEPGYVGLSGLGGPVLSQMSPFCFQRILESGFWCWKPFISPLKWYDHLWVGYQEKWNSIAKVKSLLM